MLYEQLYRKSKLEITRLKDEVNKLRQLNVKLAGKLEEANWNKGDRFVSDWLPANLLAGYKESKAYRFRSVKISREYESHHNPWPGQHRAVYYWCSLQLVLVAEWIRSRDPL